MRACCAWAVAWPGAAWAGARPGWSGPGWRGLKKKGKGRAGRAVLAVARAALAAGPRRGVGPLGRPRPIFFFRDLKYIFGGSKIIRKIKIRYRWIRHEKYSNIISNLG
jgi:hypothetical protein